MSFFTSDFWITYIIVFAIFAKSLWFVYYFALYGFPRKEEKEYYHTKVALIVPAYNEEEDKLADTIEHAKKVKGVNQIIFINDGSDKTDVVGTLKKHNNYDYIVIDLKQNVGKRRAQYEGIRRTDDDTDIFVFMDSDTLLEEDSILELIKPMQDKSIGGTTACILVKNKGDNFLTKSISAMYWTASNIWRQAPSNLGFLQVTNGQLSCYRAKLIRKLMKDYLTQDFMGVNCTLSDDRYITHYLQTEFNKKLVYTPKAEVYTYVPNTIIGAYKMFLRWKLGSLRESFLILKRFKKKPILVIDIWANHLIAIMQTLVRISIIILSFFYPIVLLYYLIIISLISLFFSFHMIVKNFREIWYRVAYSIMNEVLFSWVLIHALITIKNQGKWQTR